jgi:1-acyl-sn-glycerol-3-phosphate acyltransferase
MSYPWMRLPTFRDVDSLDNRDPALITKLARAFQPFLFSAWFKPEVRGLEHVPEGPALYVANHNGGFMTPDTWIFGAALALERGVEHVPYVLGHQVVMEAPLLNQVLTRLGGVEAKPGNAHRLLERGHKVLVYPGGDLEAFRPSHERHRVVFGPRRGYVRLALSEGVPIVPVVASGSHEGWLVLSDGRWLARTLRTHRWLRTDVLPLTLSLPWGLSLGAPPYLPWPTRILVEVLPPITFTRRGAEAAADDDYVEACHRVVVEAMQAALGRLARERRRR